MNTKSPDDSLSASSSPDIADLEEARDRQEHRELEPVLRDFQAHGYRVMTAYDITDLYHATYPPRVAQILAMWLLNVQGDWARTILAHALNNTSARGIATPALMEAFRQGGKRIGGALRGHIAMSMERTATESDLPGLMSLAASREYGTDRASILIALTKAGRSRADVVALLLQLLEDDSVAPAAAAALGRLKVREATPKIEKLLGHPEAWVRASVKRILRSLKAPPKADK